MSTAPATLYFMCGKMAAGKTTRAARLALEKHAVLIVQDELLAALYPGEILTIPDFVRCSQRLRDALTPHVQRLLLHGTPVVLDFPGNTRVTRLWFRTLFEAAGAPHEMHFMDTPDALCKTQLKQRSAGLPPGSPWTTEAEFDAITAYFQPPAEDEGFNIIRYARS